MTITIPANINEGFGGDLINQKYTVLEKVILDKETSKALRKLLDKVRKNSVATEIQYQESRNLNYGRAIVDTTPMVVVSSARSEWMKNKLEASEQDDMMFYHPSYSNRQLYVFVNQIELDAYGSKLCFPKVQVIGWQAANVYENQVITSGFGFARYAAVNYFLQYHRPMVSKIWLIDDDVFRIQNLQPDLLQNVESSLNNNRVITGFTACTKKNDNLDNIREEIKKNEHKGARPVFSSAYYEGFAQQCVCLNLAALKKEGLNYNPAFVSSREDINFLEMIKSKRLQSHIISACSVVKLQAALDKPKDLDLMRAKRKMLGNLDLSIEKELKFNIKGKDLSLEELVGIIKAKPTASTYTHQHISSLIVEQLMNEVMDVTDIPKITSKLERQLEL
jgi:hypothetical protein